MCNCNMPREWYDDGLVRETVTAFLIALFFLLGNSAADSNMAKEWKKTQDNVDVE